MTPIALHALQYSKQYNKEQIKSWIKKKKNMMASLQTTKHPTNNWYAARGAPTIVASCENSQVFMAPIGDNTNIYKTKYVRYQISQLFGEYNCLYVHCDLPPAFHFIPTFLTNGYVCCSLKVIFHASHESGSVSDLVYAVIKHKESIIVTWALTPTFLIFFYAIMFFSSY